MDNNKNIFNINEPDTCFCAILRYHLGHSRLLLQITPDKSHDLLPTYVIFSLVAYYEGPISWLGGDFRIAQHSEVLEALSKTPFHGKENKDLMEEFAKLYCLFIGGTSNTQKVRILATKHFDMANVPPIDAFPDL
jgi:hypothetical protein